MRNLEHFLSAIVLLPDSLLINSQRQRDFRDFLAETKLLELKDQDLLVDYSWRLSLQVILLICLFTVIRITRSNTLH